MRKSQTVFFSEKKLKNSNNRKVAKYFPTIGKVGNKIFTGHRSGFFADKILAM